MSSVSLGLRSSRTEAHMHRAVMSQRKEHTLDLPLLQCMLGSQRVHLAICTSTYIHGIYRSISRTLEIQTFHWPIPCPACSAPQHRAEEGWIHRYIHRYRDISTSIYRDIDKDTYIDIEIYLHLYIEI